MTIVYVVEATTRENLKTTTRTSWKRVDSVWSSRDAASKRANEINAQDEDARRDKFRGYRDATVTEVFMDPPRTSVGTDFVGTTRFENDFVVKT